MGSAKRVLAVVLAGGEGKRLMPLTNDRAKPAVPFGGIYRLIDFALSNLVNSQLRKIVVLTQYKSHSLDRHISQTWRMSTLLDNYITSVPAQQRHGKHWYLGSADAIYQNLNLINDAQPDIIVVVGADHVYRMDFSQMIQAHIESGAGATVSAIRQPVRLCSQFGVIEAEAQDPTRIRAFIEKPATVQGLPDAPDQFLASMGNYIFNTDALIEALETDSLSESSKRDMGGDIIPRFVANGDAAVYDLKRNDVPGATTERERYYWRDVGTLDSFYEAHMDLVAPLPSFNLYNSEWPIYTRQVTAPPAKFVRDARGYNGRAFDSLVSPGVVISGGQVKNSIISPNVYIDSLANVADSVVMNGSRIQPDTRVQNAILDKNVVLEEGAHVGVDRELDLARGFTVTDSGITVVTKGQRVSA